MRDSQQNNCDEIIDLLVKDFWSKYKSELNQNIANIVQDFIKRHLSNSTIRISKQFHTEFEYVNKLIDYIIGSLEKDYSHIPLEECKNKLLDIVDSEYKRLIPKATSRLVEATIFSEGEEKQFKKGILDEMEKSKERIQIRCALSEKAKVAVKPVNEKWYQSRTIQAAIITGIFMLIAAFITSPYWIPFFTGSNEDKNNSNEDQYIDNNNDEPAIVNKIGPTPLYARTKQRVDEFENKLIKEQIMPWGLIPTGKPIEVTYYDGKVMHFEGIKFSGSPRKVFWGNYIEPFLKNGIIEILDATANECRDNNLEPKPYLIETGWLLESMIRSVYENMAETDRRLLGSDKRRDVSYEIASMKQFLEEQRIAALHLLSKAERLNEKSGAVEKDETSIQPEEKDADVDRPKVSPIMKIPEANIPPEGKDGTVTEIKKRELFKKDVESIKPEGE